MPFEYSRRYNGLPQGTKVVGKRMFQGLKGRNRVVDYRGESIDFRHDIRPSQIGNSAWQQDLRVLLEIRA